MDKLQPIFNKEKKEFEKLWRQYHSRYKIPYSYDERDDFFNELVLIFREDK